MSKIVEIPIGKIQVGEHEQRLDREDEGIAELAASIVRIGLVNPLVVAACADGYTVIAGHRRLRAAKKTGLGALPCIVQETKAEVESEIAFAENFFRKDLSPVELAAAIKDVHDSGKMTLQDLQRGFGRSLHWVQSMIAICDWPADVLGAIHDKGISVAAASNLALVTDEHYRFFLLRNAVEQGASARTTASWLQAWRVMQPAEEAITSEPVPGRPVNIPAVPQAPCFLCSQVFAVNEMSHLPICGGCIQTIRQSERSG